MIKCLIFDLDGTLVDTLKDLCECSNEVLKEYNYKEINIDKFRYFVGNGIKKLIERCILESNGNINLHEEIYIKFTSHYEENCLRYAKLYPNMNKVLDELKHQNYLLFVNTNKNDQIAKFIINKLLPNYFIDIFGICDKYPSKPNPYIINLIKDKYNLNNNEIIYIGDSDVDILTAHNAGVKAIGCSYGFRERNELESANADYIIDDPLDILKVINN